MYRSNRIFNFNYNAQADREASSIIRKQKKKILFVFKAYI